MQNSNLATILNALRNEILEQSKFQVEPTTMSVSGISMNIYDPIKAVIKVNFRPTYITVSAE